ncbi:MULTISPECIES: phenylalanine--tRNA ligase subunit beta [Acetobacter]|uniref:Phenylalanine--tRNA ligase beta subunit n=1 Tax=Acetobacter pomorum DM001 TaxID=945681 RepID=F1YQA1_9PROT|nr:MULTISPECIES: phenylalanine--tRNA ligase subunit beta [Acetobacter]ATI11385.1 phenylalanine--tRNA ligase subunit beta [Acetobacter pomorum]AXC26279.1 phenylalanine--tRNA ligase subunit beta [Acetobacter sp. JWB]EGE48786.1 Phenylalanyl-tRNA synthetase beta chain [Acetobacter pomorum DM001]KAA8428168.1 phenylalanine--tRNA ligase subunit beta [Acetobacter pomorum]KAA8437199.1 phenylalanine--tRNA ligase subunit beta [Acetobacter pomorum]
MKFTLSWLYDHLDTQATLEEICAKLNQIGLEVESVENRGAAIEPFLTARILDAQPHPNADRLQVCRVDAGPGFQDVQVVCGAPNARKGLAVIFAKPGTYVPGLDITIKAGKIRGEASGGMLCSLRELGLGEESNGIAELPEDTLPGQSYADFAGLDDVVIDIAITPNRGDALGVRGVARDLAAAGLGTLRPWLAETVEGTFESPVVWDISYPEACPWVLGRTIRGVKNGPSPEWLQRKLESIGLRPISALVDITNYFCFDLGRPLHVFDAAKIAGGKLTICRGEGEQFRALDGQDYTVGPEDCVIADQAGVQSLAGIMGGEATGATAETTDVFVECALFDAVKIALSARRVGVSSDSSYRFERGVDPALPVSALEAATRLIIELCGGEASEVVSAGAQPAWQRDATLRFARVRDLGGLDVPADESVDLLEKLGFEVQDRNNTQVRVSVPSWRNDIAQKPILAQGEGIPADVAAKAAEGVAAIESESDLVEEVLRLKGLDAVPAVPLPSVVVVPEAALTPRQARLALARRFLAARGLTETVGFSFVSHEEAERFGGAPESLRLLNPIASDLDQMRPTPMINLLAAVKHNSARGWGDLGLFEVGPAFAENSQQPVVAGVRSGHTPRYPGRAGQPVSLWAVKADALELLQQLGVNPDAMSTTTDAPGWYHPGRSGVLRQGPKNVLAYFGELHPSLLQAEGIDVPVVGFELLPDMVPDPKRKKKVAPRLSAFQPVRRDFAFVVARDVPGEKLLRAVRGAERQLVADVSLFDVYEGPHVPEGHRSIGVEVTLQPMDKSLTDAELEAVSEKIVAAVTKATGATLR